MQVVYEVVSWVVAIITSLCRSPLLIYFKPASIYVLVLLNPFVSKDWEPDNIFELLGNSQARQILVLADLRPMSAQELADQCETSLPTIYRRINELVNHDLLCKQTRQEDGKQYQIFKTDLKKVCFEIDNGGFVVDIQLRQQMVNQFEDFWQELQDFSDKRDDQG